MLNFKYTLKWTACKTDYLFSPPVILGLLKVLCFLPGPILSKSAYLCKACFVSLVFFFQTWKVHSLSASKPYQVLITHHTGYHTEQHDKCGIYGTQAVISNVSYLWSSPSDTGECPPSLNEDQPRSTTEQVQSAPGIINFQGAVQLTFGWAIPSVFLHIFFGDPIPSVLET